MNNERPVLLLYSSKTGQTEKIVHRLAQELEELKAATSLFLSVSGAAASWDSEKRGEAEEYVRHFLDRTGWEPDVTASVAGAVKYTRYNPILRWVMKRINREAGHLEDVDTSRDYEYTDWERVAGIADTLARAALLGGWIYREPSGASSA